MRLIDADLLLKSIDATPQFDCIGELLKRYIDSFPTAYDVDKVVEQLKNNADYRTGEDGTVIDEHVNLKKAIDIVKSGGID